MSADRDQAAAPWADVRALLALRRRQVDARARLLLPRTRTWSSPISVTTRAAAAERGRGPALSLHRPGRPSAACATTASCWNGRRCTAISTARRARRWRRRSPRAATCSSTSTGRAPSRSRAIEALQPDLVRVFVLPPNFRRAARAAGAPRRGRAGGHPAAARERADRDRQVDRVRLRHRQRGPRPVAFRRRARSSPPSACGASASRALPGSSTACLKEARREADRRLRLSASRRKRRASFRKASTGISSARSVGSMPAASQNGHGIGPELLRLERSIFRRWPKAAAVTASTRGDRHALGIGARLEPDDRRGDLGRRREGARRHLEEEFRPRPPLREHARAGRTPLLPGAATMRSATSRWNISVRLSHQGGHGSAESQPTRSGVATL